MFPMEMAINGDMLRDAEVPPRSCSAWYTAASQECQKTHIHHVMVDTKLSNSWEKNTKCCSQVSNLLQLNQSCFRTLKNDTSPVVIPLSSFVHSRLASTDRSELNFSGPWDLMDLLDFTELVGGLVRLTSASSASSASAQKALNRCPRSPPQHHGQSRPIAGGCHGTTSLA